MRISDWSSDVCSSDLLVEGLLDVDVDAEPIADRYFGAGLHYRAPGVIDLKIAGELVFQRPHVLERHAGADIWRYRAAAKRMIGAGHGEDAELVVAGVGNRLQRAGRLVGRGRRRRSRELDAALVGEKNASPELGTPIPG